MSGVGSSVLVALLPFPAGNIYPNLRGFFFRGGILYRSSKCSRSGRYYCFSNNMKDNVWPISAPLFVVRSGGFTGGIVDNKD